jgi:hypothetical protein
MIRRCDQKSVGQIKTADAPTNNNHIIRIIHLFFFILLLAFFSKTKIKKKGLGVNKKTSGSQDIDQDLPFSGAKHKINPAVLGRIKKRNTIPHEDLAFLESLLVDLDEQIRRYLVHIQDKFLGDIESYLILSFLQKCIHLVKIALIQRTIISDQGVEMGLVMTCLYFFRKKQSNSNSIQYYVTNYNQHKIFIFDENWNYFSNNSSFPYVTYMIPVGIYFYITGDNNVWKTDTLQLLKFARAIIEEHEKDRKHNLGEDEYFNSWRN